MTLLLLIMKNLTKEFLEIRYFLENERTRGHFYSWLRIKVSISVPVHDMSFWALLRKMASGQPQDYPNMYFFPVFNLFSGDK